MAKQVGPQERKPEFLPVLRARDGDEDVLGEFHQGPQIEIQSAIRPDIRLQPIPILPKHEILLAKPGGVHIRNKMGILHNFTKGGGFDFSDPATIIGLTIAAIGIILIILLYKGK